MFVYYFDYVPRSFEAVSSALTDTSARWLSGCMTRACREAASLDSRPHENGTRPWVWARLAIGARDLRAKSLVLPVRIEVQGTGAPFNSMEADLEAGELSPEMTQLTLRGSYLPGRCLNDTEDHGLGQRIAEAATKGFVERIVARLSLASAPTATSEGQSAQVSHLGRM